MGRQSNGVLHRALSALGCGVGQVMFQDSALSGLLMLLGLACGSWQAAALALWGNMVSTFTARFLCLDTHDIRQGLYGFNGTLVGIAAGVFLQPDICMVILLTVSAALSSILFRWWPRRSIFPPMTAPFIIVTWGLLGIVRMICPQLLLTSAETTLQPHMGVMRAFWHHFGQVMFQGSTIWAGILFLLGILVHSPRQAIAAIVGAAIPLLMCVFTEADYTTFNAGMWGYNAVLCAMVFGVDTTRNAVLTISSVVLSVLFQLLGLHYGFVTLTAPFVLAVWIVRWIDRLFVMKMVN